MNYKHSKQIVEPPEGMRFGKFLLGDILPNGTFWRRRNNPAILWYKCLDGERATPDLADYAVPFASGEREDGVVGQTADYWRGQYKREQEISSKAINRNIALEDELAACNRNFAALKSELARLRAPRQEGGAK